MEGANNVQLHVRLGVGLDDHVPGVVGVGRAEADERTLYQRVRVVIVEL